MGRGGARNRSGPQHDPNSGRSDRRGLAYIQLPNGGYDGEVPAFPLPKPTAREKALWAKAWTWPQAAAWAVEPWRHETVAMWVRWKVRAEMADASAAAVAAVHRFADQVGLTPAGLRENGWVIAADEVKPVREARADVEAADKPTPPVRRLRPVVGGGN